MGRLKNTIVIILGDHGEEFWEHGQFGHTLGLTNEQIQTVFAIFFPTQPGRAKRPGRYRYSAHHDLMPTLFEYMGLELLSAGIFSGKSLLSYDPARDFVLTGKGVVKDQAPSRLMVIGDGLKVEFTPEDPSRPEKILLDDDRAPNSPIEKQRIKRLLELGQKLGG
jgi:membrane-anchored protein YejM (alkaline phosphatase superfamily)